MQFLFDPESIRSAESAPEDSARLVWLFLSLMRRKEISYELYRRAFPRGERTYKRDIGKLRELGTLFGFALSSPKRGVVALLAIDGAPGDRRLAESMAADTLRALGDALGAIVSNDVSAYMNLSAAPIDPFLRVATPRLIGDGAVAFTYDVLRAAWLSRARVRFLYRSATGRGQPEERTVEPHVVTYYGGRYYLVAFDRRPKTNGWRQFALDRIAGPIRRAGTFEARAVPPHYRGDDAIGLFKSERKREVTIEVSPLIASAVEARRWQRGQRVAPGREGWTAITFDVYDAGEAIRWALGFGREARIAAPEDAVALARETVTFLHGVYRSADATGDSITA